MTNPRTKSIAEQIEECVAERDERLLKYEAMKQGLKSTEKAWEMITRLDFKIDYLQTVGSQPHLSDTCKTHLKKWLIRELTGKRVDFKSKPTDKGNAVEDDAIVYASCHIPEMGLCCKNEMRFKNEWIQGTPDVLSGEWVFDLKCSVSAETFPLFEDELPESNYAWQVLGYMAIANARRAAIVYALMSTPDEMIEREARYKLGPNYSREEYEAFAANYQYEDLPPAMRLKKFEVEYDETKIEAIKARVLECRAYVGTVLWPTYLSNQKQFEL